MTTRGKKLRLKKHPATTRHVSGVLIPTNGKDTRRRVQLPPNPRLERAFDLMRSHEPLLIRSDAQALEILATAGLSMDAIPRDLRILIGRVSTELTNNPTAPAKQPAA